MRIVSLLPAATEIVAALGAAEELVGISHECDFPPAVTALPRVTATPIDAAAPGGAIDAEVRRLRAAGRPVIAADAAALRRLAPDLILTQGLCEVCAVADGEIHRLAAVMEPAPRVVSLGATTLRGIWRDIGTIGRVLGRTAEAERLVGGLATRLRRLRTTRAPAAPRAVCIEWLDPVYLAGHWVPELLEAAGATDLGARPGDRSTLRTWAEVAALNPELVVVTLCGLGVARSRQELAAVTDPVARGLLGGRPVWILDGNAYTSRAGPRVVNGAERLRLALRNLEAPGLVHWQAPWRGAGAGGAGGRPRLRRVREWD